MLRETLFIESSGRLAEGRPPELSPREWQRFQTSPAS
jgi:hypothetical protein